MKKRHSQLTKILLPLVAMTALSAGANASTMCGTGKIAEIKEGAFNTNDVYILIEGTTDYVRYRDNLDPERLRGIRAVAYLAMAGDKTVETRSHNNTATDDGCTKATELIIKR